MVLVFYKVGFKHALLVPCIAEEELLIKFPFLVLEIIDGADTVVVSWSCCGTFVFKAT